MKTHAIKSLGNRSIGGYGILYSDENHPDLEGDFFTPDTDFWFDRGITPKALLFDHAMTPLPDDIRQAMGMGITDKESIWIKALELSSDRPKKQYAIGTVTKVVPDEFGIWVECILDEHNEYADYVLDLVNDGVMGYSSDSVGHLVQKETRANGANWIKSWAMPLISATHHPAEPRLLLQTIKHILTPDELNDLLDDATKAALRDRTPQAESPNKTNEVTMALKTTEAARLSIAKTLIKDNIDEYKSIDWQALAAKATGEEEMPEVEDAEKQTGSELEALVRPLADQFASIFGIPVEEALAVILNAGIALQQPAVSEEVVTEEMPAAFETEATMSQFPKSLNKAKVKTALGLYQTKNVMVNVQAKSQYTLGRFIKAQFEHDHTYLKAYRNHARTAYKAQGINPDSAGGYLVAPEQSNEIIELLRPQSVFLGGGLVTERTMTTNDLYIPRMDGGITSAWIGENAVIQPTEAEFGQIHLVARKLAVLVPISNEVLEDSNPDIETAIREDIAREFALRIDQAILYGSGIDSIPLGIKTRPEVTKTALNAAPGYSDLTGIVERVETANVTPDDSWRWVFNSKAKRVIREIQDDGGQYIWTGTDGIGRQMSGDVASELLGYGWVQSNSIPSSGDPLETDIYFGRWRDVILGMRKTIEIRASDEAGTSFASDQTWVRAILRADVGMRHDESIELLTDVRV